MGYTSFTIGLLEKTIERFHPKNVLDLGSQQLYNQPLLPAPYVDGWYKAKGIHYECIDLNGENNAWQIDLSKPFQNKAGNGWHGQFMFEGWQMIVDAGTSEHVGDNGAFSWEAIYNCWKTKHDLLQTGCVMVNENPKTLNWPLHGYNYYKQEFYNELANYSDYEILELGEHPAMGNSIDGWNIYCVLQKHSEKFPTLEQFKTMSIKTS